MVTAAHSNRNFGIKISKRKNKVSSPPHFKRPRKPRVKCAEKEPTSPEESIEQFQMGFAQLTPNTSYSKIRNLYNKVISASTTAFDRATEFAFIRASNRWRVRIIPPKTKLEVGLESLQLGLARRLEKCSGNPEDFEDKVSEASGHAMLIYYLVSAFRLKQAQVFPDLSKEEEGDLNRGILRTQKRLAERSIQLVREYANDPRIRSLIILHHTILRADYFIAEASVAEYRKSWRPEQIYQYQPYDAIYACVDTISLDTIPKEEWGELVQLAKDYCFRNLSQILEDLIKKAVKGCDQDTFGGNLRSWIALYFALPRTLMDLFRELIANRYEGLETIEEDLLPFLVEPMIFEASIFDDREGKAIPISYEINCFKYCFRLDYAVEGKFSPTQMDLLRKRAEKLFDEKGINSRETIELGIFLLTDLLFHEKGFQFSLSRLNKPFTPVLKSRTLRREVLKRIRNLPEDYRADMKIAWLTTVLELSLLNPEEEILVKRHLNDLLKLASPD